MERKVRQVIRSKKLDEDVTELYQYGIETFGTQHADAFLEYLKASINSLSTKYLLHPECKHLETKSQIYRNIIIGRYLIIYRIKSNNIEVLRALHGNQSPKIIKATRKIKTK